MCRNMFQLILRLKLVLVKKPSKQIASSIYIYQQRDYQATVPSFKVAYGQVSSFYLARPKKRMLNNVTKMYVLESTREKFDV